MGGSLLGKRHRVVRQPDLNSTRGGGSGSCGSASRPRNQGTAPGRSGDGETLTHRATRAQSTAPSHTAARPQSGPGSPQPGGHETPVRREPHPNPGNPRTLASPVLARPPPPTRPSAANPAPGRPPSPATPRQARSPPRPSDAYSGKRAGVGEQHSVLPRLFAAVRSDGGRPARERCDKPPRLRLSGRALRPPFANGRAWPLPIKAAGQRLAARSAPCRPGGRMDARRFAGLTRI